MMASLDSGACFNAALGIIPGLKKKQGRKKRSVGIINRCLSKTRKGRIGIQQETTEGIGKREAAYVLNSLNLKKKNCYILYFAELDHVIHIELSVYIGMIIYLCAFLSPNLVRGMLY